MVSDWQELPVDELCDIYLGGTPKRANSDYWGGSVKWASAKDIVNCRNCYITSTEETITQKGIEESAAKILQKGTIIITARGTVGVICMLGEPMAFNQSCYGLVVKPMIISPYFYYALKTTLSKIRSISYGTVFETITTKSFKDIMIPLPSIDTQRAIAHILGSLDNKIELNRRMNKMLEAMARAIFKSWFVDFDPVIDNALKAGNPIPEAFAGRALQRKGKMAKARAEGKESSLPDEISSLFPDSFQDSELGYIPRGWEIKPLDNIALLKTQIIQPKNFKDKMWEYYSIPAFDEGRQPVCEVGQDIKSGKYAVPEDCILASKLNPQFPRVWLPDVQDADSAICSTEFMPFVPSIKFWRPFLYEMLQSHSVQSTISSRVTGSTGSRQRVKPKEIAVMPCLVPQNEVVNTFCEQVGPLHDIQLSNIRQSTSLASLRDTLLPKLISGELRIPYNVSTGNTL